MADNNNPNDEPHNPFKGTPMEHLFGQLSGGQLDFNQLMSQMQRMFEPHEGTVNFNVAKDVARQVLAAKGADPTPNAGQRNAVSDAQRLADMWLDQATEIPARPGTTAAWSRAEWIENTMQTWQVLVDPIANHVVASMSDVMPAEAKAMAGPLIGILTQAGSAMFGQQLGQGIAGLATEVLSSSEVGLPLGPAGVAAVVPHNVQAFAEGLEHSQADVLLYVMLREQAYQRLYEHAPWLRGAVVDAIEEFGRGTRIDTDSIQSSMMDIDPSRPEAIQEALNGGLFEPKPTPEQQHARDRIELLLALVEGWVDEVVAQATAHTMPAAVALAEAMRRRRATGGPAEQTFASLVGLELRPRRMRDALNLWSATRDRLGARTRDSFWSHPDMLPTAADLDDPLGFVERQSVQTLTDDEFDAALEELLEQETDPGDSSEDSGTNDTPDSTS